MEIYFANKSGKPTTQLFNSNQPQKQPPPQQAPRNIATDRKSVLMQDKQQTLKEKIKVEVVGLNVYKMKLNPDIYTFNLDTILMTQKMESIDFLDEIQLRNQEKRQNYQDLMTISNQLSSMTETKTLIKHPNINNDPVKEVMNLLGCDPKRAAMYLQKYGSVEKVYTGYNNEKNTV